MKKIVKAFAIGFISVSLLMLLLQVLAPSLGVTFKLGVTPTFQFHKTSTVHASWITPLLVGVIFALAEALHQYRPLFQERMRKGVDSQFLHDLSFVIWRCLWGLSIGFVGTMLIFALLIGTEGSYSLPFLFTAEASSQNITGSTVLISLGGILGAAYGIIQLKLHSSSRSPGTHEKTRKK